MKIGIDLALRKIGIVVLGDDNKLIDFILLDSDSKKYNDESLLLLNSQRIIGFISGHYWTKHAFRKIDEDIFISLEGLSFNSKSANIDLIDANHWMVRCNLKEKFPNMNWSIIYPKSWQKHIVTKDILADWVIKWPIIRAKKGMKLTADQKKSNNKSKAEIRKLTKQYIYDSLPSEIKEKFNEYIKSNKLPKDSIYDLSDAYYLACGIK